MNDNQNNEEQMQENFITLRELNLTQNELLERFDTHPHYQYSNQDELFNTIIDRCASYKKLMLLESQRNIKKLSSDDIVFIIRNYYLCIAMDKIRKEYIGTN